MNVDLKEARIVRWRDDIMDLLCECFDVDETFRVREVDAVSFAEQLAELIVAAEGRTREAAIAVGMTDDANVHSLLEQLVKASALRSEALQRRIDETQAWGVHASDRIWESRS